MVPTADKKALGVIGLLLAALLVIPGPLLAQDEAAVDAAERSVVEARIALADAMGLEVGDGAVAPLASDAFPRIPPEARAASLQPEALVAIAYDQRMDLRSARKLEESGKVLLEAARINRRPIVDLDLGPSRSGIH